MQSGVFKSQGFQAASVPRLRRRYVACCVVLLGVASGCGSDVIDAGELVEVGEAGEAGSSGAPDAGSEQGGAGGAGGASSGCTIPGLDQYRLLFDSDGGRLERRIYSMRADGTELEAITPVEELAREAALSPDGSQLAYTTPEGIKLRDMATGQTELLLPDDSQPAWSPDGTQLTYNSRLPNLFSVLAMADRVDQISFLCSSCLQGGAEIAPDGFTVMYSDAFVPDGVEPKYTVLMQRWQTGEGVVGSLEIVPATSISVTHPTLSPDGTWVAAAYQCPREDRSSIWVSPFTVSTPACEGRRTTRAGSASATNPKWGPGLLIAYEYGEPPRDIAIVSADTGEECVIERPGDDRNPSWGSSAFELPQ